MNARPDRASPGSVYGGTSDGRECRHGCYLATAVPVTTRLCMKVGLTFHLRSPWLKLTRSAKLHHVIGRDFVL